jgi:hypothetical protein
MALELVTTDEAKSHLRISGTADDSWLAIFIPAISGAVALWLKDSWRLYVPEEDSGGIVVDSSGDPVPFVDSNGYITQPVVKAAVLIELSSQYRFREGEGTDNVVTPDAGHGYMLNKASTNILTALRKTTLA